MSESVEQAAPPSIADVMRMVQDDCKSDADRVDTTPFTAKGVGETFGSTLAMLCAVARAVELLSEKVDAR